MATRNRFDLVGDRHQGQGDEGHGRSQDHAQQAAERHPFRTGFIVGAAVTVAMTLLIIQNGETVKFEWSVLDLEWPLWVILLVSFVAGMVAWQLCLHEIRRIHKMTAARRLSSDTSTRVARIFRPKS